MYYTSTGIAGHLVELRLLRVSSSNGAYDSCAKARDVQTHDTGDRVQISLSYHNMETFTLNSNQAGRLVIIRTAALDQNKGPFSRVVWPRFFRRSIKQD